MKQFQQFACLLSPKQTSFIKIEDQQLQHDNQLSTSLLSTNQSEILASLYQLNPQDASKIYVCDIGHTYTIYGSILSQLCPKYNLFFTFDQQLELINAFIQFAISKLQTDSAIQSIVKYLKIRPNTLIKQLKQEIHYSKQVVWYVSLILDLNLIVLSMDDHRIEVYYGDQTYDNCKPHLLIMRTALDIYQPVIYDRQRLLSYFDHPIIPTLLSYQNKIEINFDTFATK